jgi:hypothetical protein
MCLSLGLNMEYLVFAFLADLFIGVEFKLGSDI